MKVNEKKPVYILCPRCELNYINKKDKHCNVCKAEMGLLDPSILIPDEEEAGIEKLCPVCHVNYIGEDEELCFLCEKEKVEKVEVEEPDDAWINFVDEVPEAVSPEEMEISLSELAEEENGDEDDEFADKYAEPDDFDYDVDPNDYLEDDDDESEDDDEFGDE